eukprot:5586682-Pleurochrysis_carterae.AAC.1
MEATGPHRRADSPGRPNSRLKSALALNSCCERVHPQRGEDAVLARGREIEWPQLGRRASSTAA